MYLFDSGECTFLAQVSVDLFSHPGSYHGGILGMGAAPLWSAKCTYLTQDSVDLFAHPGSHHLGNGSSPIVLR